MSRKTYGPTTTYLEWLDQIPPAYCRLIARENWKGGNGPGGYQRILTITEIAERSGLSWQRTAAIARRKSFATVTVEDADKFRKGCGITLQNEQRHMAFIKRNFKKDQPFKEYFKNAKFRYPFHSWKSKFMNRILERL